MTGTYFFTFLFLLSFLCFIKGNTKGKLCYLLKNVKVHFKQEEKKQTHCCLDREGRLLTGSQRLGWWGHREIRTPLTSGFFSPEAPILPGHADLRKELQDQVDCAFWGGKGASLTSCRQRNEIMDRALGAARISRQLGKDGPGTEDAGPGSEGTMYGSCPWGVAAEPLTCPLSYLLESEHLWKRVLVTVTCAFLCPAQLYAPETQRDLPTKQRRLHNRMGVLERGLSSHPTVTLSSAES